MHSVPMNGCRFFYFKKHQNTSKSGLHLDIAGSPAHFNYDSQVGWTMHHWLKKAQWDKKQKKTPTESDYTLGLYFDMQCWVCESPLGNDPIWLVFNRVAHPPSCFVDWLSSTNVKFCRKQTRGPWWFHFDAWVERVGGSGGSGGKSKWHELAKNQIHKFREWNHTGERKKRKIFKNEVVFETISWHSKFNKRFGRVFLSKFVQGSFT